MNMHEKARKNRKRAQKAPEHGYAEVDEASMIANVSAANPGETIVRVTDEYGVEFLPLRRVRGLSEDERAAIAAGDVFTCENGARVEKAKLAPVDVRATKVVGVVLCDGGFANVSSFAEASRRVVEEIDARGMGSAEWYSHDAGYVVAEGNRRVARVSYNGRLWGLDGEPLRVLEGSSS